LFFARWKNQKEGTKVADEHTLPDAVDRLYAAVGGLVDPAKELINGAVLAGPSAYAALVSEIPSKSSGNTYSRGAGRSIPAAWVDAVDLRVQIDTRTKQMQPEGHSTPHRLRALASRRWAPPDTTLVREYAEEIGSWVLSIRALLEPESVKQVSVPCPSCGTRWVYRNNAGEQVRQSALQIITHTGCKCLACKSYWPPSAYLFLCRLMGLELPTGLVPTGPPEGAADSRTPRP